MIKNFIAAASFTLSMSVVAENVDVADHVLSSQREALAFNTDGMGFGPQSPRDIDSDSGENTIIFNKAPKSKKMNLCNIHFHESAEHKGGQFSDYVGNGDGHGYGSGYKYSGKLKRKESQPIDNEVCVSSHGGLQVGDTIEVHYVHSTAKVEPGPTLGSCLSESIMNPQLRVEAQVFVLVNDYNALDFGDLTEVGQENGYYQAINKLNNTGRPYHYNGSTTGPSYNEKGSPLQVSWSVRPKVAKVDISTVGTWCQGNVFDEDHGHGVRNLVINPNLLSDIHD